jgi:hypothetical protein
LRGEVQLRNVREASFNALGRGKRFFRDGDEKTTLTLSDVKTNGAGVVMLTYRAAQRA